MGTRGSSPRNYMGSCRPPHPNPDRKEEAAGRGSYRAGSMVVIESDKHGTVEAWQEMEGRADRRAEWERRLLI